MTSNWLYGMMHAVLRDLNNGEISILFRNFSPFQNIVVHSFKLICFGISSEIVVNRPDLAVLYYPVTSVLPMFIFVTLFPTPQVNHGFLLDVEQDASIAQGIG